MPTLTRRGLIVLGGTGAAGAVLTACGAETEARRDSGDDGTLLSDALAAERALGAAYAEAAGSAGGEERSTLEAFARASQLRGDDLESRTDGAEDGDADAPTEQGLAGAIAAAEGAIAAYRDNAGLLSSADDRSTSMLDLVAVAAELAAVRELDGADPVPFPFVTGQDEPPLVAPDNTATEEEDSES
jgi:hypothetical protein